MCGLSVEGEDEKTEWHLAGKKVFYGRLEVYDHVKSELKAIWISSRRALSLGTVDISFLISDVENPLPCAPPTSDTGRPIEV